MISFSEKNNRQILTQKKIRRRFFLVERFPVLPLHNANTIKGKK